MCKQNDCSDVLLVYTKRLCFYSLNLCILYIPAVYIFTYTCIKKLINEFLHKYMHFKSKIKLSIFKFLDCVYLVLQDVVMFTCVYITVCIWYYTCLHDCVYLVLQVVVMFTRVYITVCIWYCRLLLCKHDCTCGYLVL